MTSAHIHDPNCYWSFIWNSSFSDEQHIQFMYNTIVQLNSDTSLILPFTPDTRNGVMITVILRYNSSAQPFLHNAAFKYNICL